MRLASLRPLLLPGHAMTDLQTPLTGPIWVPSSLIFSLFLTSSLWSSVVAYLDEREYSYDFTRLGAATSVV